jgi:spore coat polysaccharide biosynthesis protein SpsF (cytidylyltransferase family)
MQSEHEEWYRKHLYVLFTRPTARLVVNYDVKEDFERVKKMIKVLQENGAKISTSFFG